MRRNTLPILIQIKERDDGTCKFAMQRQNNDISVLVHECAGNSNSTVCDVLLLV